MTFNAYVRCYKLINRKGKISLFASLEDQMADYHCKWDFKQYFQRLNAENCGFFKKKKKKGFSKGIF